MLNLLFQTTMLYASESDPSANNWSSTVGILGRFFSILFLMGALLFFVYYFIKLTSKGRIANKKNQNLEVVESLAVSFQSYIQLIRVGQKYILIGVNKDKITLLAEYTSEDLVFSENAEGETKKDFKTILSIIQKNIQHRGNL